MLIFHSPQEAGWIGGTAFRSWTVPEEVGLQKGLLEVSLFQGSL